MPATEAVERTPVVLRPVTPSMTCAEAALTDRLKWCRKSIAILAYGTSDILKVYSTDFPSPKSNVSIFSLKV